LKERTLDVLVFELAEIGGAIPVEHAFAQEFHERHGSVVFEDG
jgi:hypothetical protein